MHAFPAFNQFLSVLFLFATLMSGCSPGKDAPVDGDYNIAPLPVVMDTIQSAFLIDESTWIQMDSFDEATFDPLEVFQDVFERKSGYRIRSTPDRKDKQAKEHLILVVRSPGIIQPEAYQLRVKPFGVIISAAKAEGVFYALQTLRQLMRLDVLPDIEEGSTRSWAVPAVEMRDGPAFPYRGLHLDVSRHMMPVEFVKKYIDLLAYYKFNRFHWHLTDDQGWRIEIKQYPKLQEIAAFRKETRVGHYSSYPEKYDGQRYGGYYTQQEIRDIVAYAAQRNVDVIPEIEMPGHALAALSAYPELGCTGGPYEAATTWGVFEDVFCPKETTFKFLENVLDEVIELFPSTYIHIGGDECPKTRWKSCAHCQGLIREKGLQDEHGLQSYFIQRIEKYLNEKGRQIIGWDEILEGGLAPNATVMSWRGTQGGIEAANAGHQVIMTPTSHCYLDYYQADPSTEPLAIGGLTTLEKVYSFQPIPEALDNKASKFILGGQGNLWTEYIPTPEQAEYMAYPRAIALAEALWTDPDRQNWNEFTVRLSHHLELLDGMNVNYSKSFLKPTVDVSAKSNGLNLKFKTALPRQTIFYSRDTLSGVWGNAMTGESIPVEGAGPVYYRTEHSPTFHVNYQPSLSIGATITASFSPSEQYPGGDGLNTLKDGLSGNRYHNGKDWCGWRTDRFVITLTWPEPLEVDSILIGLLNSPGAWILLPEKIVVEGSSGGSDFTMLTEWQHKELSQGRQSVSLDLADGPVTRLRLTIEPFKAIPEGLPGAGARPWTFLDEIAILP